MDMPDSGVNSKKAIRRMTSLILCEKICHKTQGTASRGEVLLFAGCMPEDFSSFLFFSSSFL